MTTPAKDYTITAQVHINNLNTDGTVTPGWQITAQDSETGVSIPVFVDDAHYTPDGVDTAIRHVLERVRAVHKLGG